MLRFCIAIICSILGIACTASRKNTIATTEKTAFVTIQQTRDTLLNTSSFKVTQIKVVDGKITFRSQEEKTHEPDFLKIHIVNKNKTSVTVYTEHPLYKKFDLYSESGEIESKLISLQQGEVTFRIPFYGDYKTIHITETHNFKTQKVKTIKHEK